MFVLQNNTTKRNSRRWFFGILDKIIKHKFGHHKPPPPKEQPPPTNPPMTNPPTTTTMTTTTTTTTTTEFGGYRHNFREWSKADCTYPREGVHS